MTQLSHMDSDGGVLRPYGKAVTFRACTGSAFIGPPILPNFGSI